MGIRESQQRYIKTRDSDHHLGTLLNQGERLKVYVVVSYSTPALQGSNANFEHLLVLSLSPQTQKTNKQKKTLQHKNKMLILETDNGKKNQERLLHFKSQEGLGLCGSMSLGTFYSTEPS